MATYNTVAVVNFLGSVSLMYCVANYTTLYEMSMVGYIMVHGSIIKDLRTPESHCRIILAGQKETDGAEEKEINLIYFR